MRILFLIDTPKNAGAKSRILSLLPALASASHECGVVSFRPAKNFARELAEIGVPLRALQFFDLGLNFYAPKLTSSLGLFQPDVVAFSSTGTLVQGGPLSRAFKGLALVSIAAFARKPNWFVRHALRRSHLAFFPDEISREQLLRILPEEKIAPLSAENFLSFLTEPPPVPRGKL